MSKKFGCLIIASALGASLFGCASQPQSARDLLTNSATGGQHIVWDLKQDFLLDEHQAASLKSVPKGAPVEMAAKIVEAVSRTEGLSPASYPVALSCTHPNLTVITSDSLSPKYVEQGCSIVRKI
ncbi:hypothetical protein ACUVZD_000086 [Pseudomonas aeruginosa]